MIWSEAKKGFESKLAESELLYCREGAVWTTHRFGRRVRLIPAYEAGVVRIEAETGIENPKHPTETFALMRHLSVFSYKRGELRFDAAGRIVYGCEMPIEGAAIDDMVSCMAASAGSSEQKLRECAERGRIRVEDELDDCDDCDGTGDYDADDDDDDAEGCGDASHAMHIVRDALCDACLTASVALVRMAGKLAVAEGGRR